ncbi:MAG: hypothetical protein ACOYJH_01715 [Anaerovoracaceae bacterium]
MRKELEHFYIGSSYGGNQDWFRSYMMRLGGCAAETACDSSVYFALHKGMKEMVPFDPEKITKKDYVDFSEIMKPYLRPRWSGINTLEIYMDGYARYMRDAGAHGIRMDGLEGGEPVRKAKQAVIDRIDRGFPVPCLILHHKAIEMDFYVWHWFLLNGYDAEDGENGRMSVKAVTYSSYRWLDFDVLWDSGYKNKGGIIIYSKPNQ